MCGGSKVPPRSPVRTWPRIGLPRWEEAQTPGDIGLAASDLGQGVDIHTPDPKRHVNSRLAVWSPGRGDPLAPLNHRALADFDGAQVGDRDLESGGRLDGDAPHAGDAPGEGHPSGGRSSDRLTDPGGVVDTPVPRILAEREEGYGHLPRHRGAEAHGRKDQDSEHLLPWFRTYRASLTGSRGLPLC